MTGLGLRRRVGSESENENERSVGMHFSSVAILIFSLLSMPFFSESIKLFLWFLSLFHLYFGVGDEEKSESGVSVWDWDWERRR
jgi:hypothetical protein